jgi:hypothetical protein
MANSWRRNLLLARIRELSDAEYTFMSLCFDVGVVGRQGDYAVVCQLRKRAIAAYQKDDLDECERLCVLAERKSCLERTRLERRIAHA